MELIDIAGAGGGKGGGGSPHVAIEANDTLGSNQVVRLLFAVNDGEIDAIEEIYLNRTPISSFAGASWDWRPGTADQSVINGFSETENPLAGFAPMQLAHGTPYTHNVDYEVTSVRLTFGLQALRQVLDNGDVVGYTVNLEINVKTTALSPQLFYATVRKSGKSSGAYSWDVRVDRPAGAIPGQAWQFVIERATQTDNARTNSVTSLSSVTEIRHITPALNYPNTALVALTIRDAEQFGSRVPEVTFKIRGRKIYLPTNYNPVSRYYDESSIWGMGFKIYREWTDNPVWHLYSILTEKMGIEPYDIDVGSFYNEAKYADQLVSNGNGGSEPRFTINNQFYQRENVTTFLMYLLTLCNANFSTNEFGQITLVSDRAGRSITKIVNNTNVVEGRFSYSSNDLENRYSLVNVTYNNPYQMGDTSTATYSDDSLIDRYGLQISDVVLAGCYSEAAAIRKARWATWVSSYDTEIIGFSVGLSGMSYRIGELVKVQDARNSGFAHQGVVFGSSDNGAATTLMLDRSVELVAEPYTVSFIAADGVSVITKAILQSNGTVSQVSFNSLDAPYPSSAFVLETATKKPIIARVSSIKKQENEYVITCIRHNESKYAYIEGTVITPPPSADFVNLSNFSVSAPVNVFASERFSSDGVNSHSRLLVTWDWNLSATEKHAATYLLLWRRDSQAYNVVKDLVTKEYDIENPVPGQYDIVVYAINPISGMKSPASEMYVYNYRNTAATSSLDPVINVVVQGTNGLIFNSADLLLSIQHNPANDEKVDKLLDYICELWTADGMTRKATLVVPKDTDKNGLLRVSFVDNIATFGLATRTFQVKIYCRDLTGRLSVAKAVTVSNPVPAAMSFDMIAGVGVTYMKLIPPDEPDVVGFKVWRSDTASFVKGLATEVYDGPDTYPALSSVEGATYYYAVAAYDSFGKEGLNVGSEQSITILSLNVDAYTYTGLTFKPNDPATNSVSWSEFVASKNGTDSVTVAAGNAAWTAGILYLYYLPGNPVLQSTTTLGVAVGGRILATYKGGTDLTHDAGKAFISGDQLLAGSVGANHLIADSAVITHSAQFASAVIPEFALGSGVVNDAAIKDYIQSTVYSSVNKTGWKIDKSGKITTYGQFHLETVDAGVTKFFQNERVIKIFDAAGVMRVRLGDFSA